MSQDIIPVPLIDALNRGRVIPFLGAAAAPDASGLTGSVLKSEMITSLQDGASPPPDISNWSLAEVAQAFYDIRGRTALEVFVCEQIDKHKINEYGTVHRLIAEVAKQGKVKYIATTNFDDMIEKALKSAGLEVHKIVDKETVELPPDKLVVFKIHGDYEKRSTMVLTNEDYDIARSEREKVYSAFQNVMGGHRVLFIGYSLADGDLRQVYREVKDWKGNYFLEGFAVQKFPENWSSEQWHAYRETPWRKRGIELISADSLDFVSELSKRISEQGGKAK